MSCCLERRDALKKRERFRYFILQKNRIFITSEPCASLLWILATRCRQQSASNVCRIRGGIFIRENCKEKQRERERKRGDTSAAGPRAYVFTRTSELVRIKLPEESTAEVEVHGGRCARLNARNSPNRVSRALMGDGISPGAVNPQQQQQRRRRRRRTRPIFPLIGSEGEEEEEEAEHG